jgi:hypothetical protein
MKKLILFITFIIVISSFNIYYLDDTLYNYYLDYFSSNKGEIINNNDYYKSSNFDNSFINNKFNIKNDDIVNNYNELLDMYFTIIYNDYENYIFNCNYDNCINDIEKLDNNKDFNSINQFVKVYSSYEKIYNSYSMNKRINVKVTKRYSEEEIKQINDKIDSIIKELKIDKEENVYDKIKLFHDYIANTNKYDSDRENNSSKYHSDKAIGTLFEGYSVCNGYADTMSIFLDKIGVSNIKVATDDHVWNAIYLNDKWYHIDLTWDDPINNLKKDMIIYDYFMITTDELLNKNDNEHSFDKEIYSFIN